MPALLLVGHGSLSNPASARPVYRLADAVAASGLFSVVRTAFWKEEPAIVQGVRALSGEDLVVLPVFAADSYFTDTVIPREIGLTPGGRRPETHLTVEHGGRLLRYTRPLGAHPALREAILDAARRAAGDAGLDPATTTLVLAARGGQRRSAGRAASERAAALSGTGGFDGAVAWFPWDHDQPHWTELTASAAAVIVPHVLTDWWFSAEPLPPELAEAPVGRTAVLAEPLASAERFVEAMLDLAGVTASVSRQEDAPAPREALRAFLERAGSVLLAAHTCGNPGQVEH
ncbi:MAG TPA: CbiX/SirB N-terminal domain-containing protein, partial [Deinococcales bacterium]|nr:CbiX/SirB N-terminal domain-containing protein [Deinococcales bacterium]